MFAEPEPDEGPVLVTVEYQIDPNKAAEFLDAIHDYERIRRRDGATRWGVFYDAEVPGRYVENFLVESWAEHARQHDRFTLADGQFEEAGEELCAGAAEDPALHLRGEGVRLTGSRRARGRRRSCARRRPR